MKISARQLHMKSRPDSDLELTVDGGWRGIGRINRVGRKWIARFEVDGREPFEQDFTARSDATAWMQTEFDAYTDILGSTEGFTRFHAVVTRNGMYAGDLADLVDILTDNGYPVIIPTGIYERKPEYYVIHSNEVHKHGYLAYVGPSRRKSGIRDQAFLVQDPGVVASMKAAFPKQVAVLGDVALKPSSKNHSTIEEARARLLEERNLDIAEGRLQPAQSTGIR